MTPTDLSFAILAFTSLLAIVNPLSAATLFVGLSATFSEQQRRRAIVAGLLTAFLVMLVFASGGPAILTFFGITTDAFRIAGGIIFFGIGSDMLQAKRSRVKTSEEEEHAEAESGRTDVGVVPLGLPTLAGPGAITTVITLMGQAVNAKQAAAVYGAIGAVSLLSGIVLVVAPFLLRVVGQTGLNVITRIMGLLVTVIGVQIVLDGLRGAIPGIFSAG
jgi:multiple antibiotic resistance protein